MRPFHTRAAAVGCAAALLALVAVFWAAHRQTSRVLAAADRQQHTRDVIAQIRALLAHALDADTASRGFVITGDERFLDPYREALRQAPDDLAGLRRLTADNPAQQRRVDSLEGLLDAKLRGAERWIELRRERGLAAVTEETQALAAKRVMDEVRALVAEMERVEEALLAGRSAQVARETAAAARTQALGATLGAGLLVVVFLVLAREARERRRAGAAREASEARLQAILDNMPVPVWVKDLDGRFLFVNRPLESLFGRPRDEILGRTDHDFWPRELAEVHRANDLEVADRDAALEAEETALLADGLHTYVSFKFPLRDPSGAPSGVCGVAIDLTDRKRAEEQARAAKEAAEQAARRAEAARDEELAARERAEAAVGELEAFSYSVSHDLRAPLRAVDGFCQALIEDYAERLDGPGRTYLERARAAARHMARLIDDLLVLSRLSRLDLEPRRVDLSTLARDVAAELRRGEPSRDATFAIEDGLVADGDPRLLRAALENLLGNAWKFTRLRRGAHIEFDAARDGGRTVYRVRDDGAGFDMAYADKLFSPFQRLHSAGQFEGTGIGLATVSRVVRRHGGAVWAEGAVGQGATFYFTLGERDAARAAALEVARG